mgnify:CR=1 FL=1
MKSKEQVEDRELTFSSNRKTVGNRETGEVGKRGSFSLAHGTDGRTDAGTHSADTTSYGKRSKKQREGEKD